MIAPLLRKGRIITAVPPLAKPIDLVDTSRSLAAQCVLGRCPVGPECSSGSAQALAE